MDMSIIAVLEWIFVRLMIPILALIGIAYLLRKSGLAVIENPKDPNEDNEDAENLPAGEQGDEK